MNKTRLVSLDRETRKSRIDKVNSVMLKEVNLMRNTDLLNEMERKDLVHGI